MTIPPVVRSLYPRMKEKDYEMLKNHPIFVQMPAAVCEDCYLKITKSCEFSGSEQMLREKICGGVNNEVGREAPQSKFVFKSIEVKKNTKNYFERFKGPHIFKN